MITIMIAATSVLIIATFTGYVKELYLKNKMLAFINIVGIFSAAWLLLAMIQTEAYKSVIGPMTLFCLSFGFLESFRLKGNIGILLTDSSKMPPMDRKTFLKHTFGTRGQRSAYASILLFFWFFLGAIYSTLGFKFFGLDNQDFLICVLGMGTTFISCYMTFYNNGRGFFRGIGDICTGAMALLIWAEIPITKNDELFGATFLLLIGLSLILSGLYLGNVHKHNSSVREFPT